MNLKFANSEKKAGNKGSVKTLVNYLEKENSDKSLIDSEYFFNHHRETIFPDEVVNFIDSNNRKLSSKDSKFFMLVISPSEAELAFINNDKEKLRLYTRQMMDAYAENFNKGLKGDDLLYYAKIEEYRYTSRFNKKKEIKPGKNFHVHIIVSRRDKNQYYKLSPMTNHRNTNLGPVKGGFCRKDLMIESEQIFDKTFNYNRTIEETWNYQFAKKHKLELPIETAVEIIQTQKMKKGIKMG
jgi:hypothetical protein